MTFELLPANPTDSPALTTVFLSAFSDPFNQRLFPPTPDVTAYWTAQFTSFITSPHKTVLKIINSADGAIVAFAVWQLPAHPSPEDGLEKGSHSQSHSGGESLNHHPYDYPASSDKELCALFFTGMEEMRGRIMGRRPHYCMSFALVSVNCVQKGIQDGCGLIYPDLEMLGTRPGYHGQGLASRLLRWGLERADEVGLETYLSSSPAGRPLYEKYGFRVVEEREVVGGYVQGYMLRAGRDD